MTSTKKDKNIDIGQRLSIFRKALTLIGAQIADAIGKTRQSWAGYESGSVEPPLAVLTLLVKKYRLNMNWLLTGEGDMLIGEVAPVSSGQMMPDEKDHLITELLLENRELRKSLEGKSEESTR